MVNLAEVSDLKPLEKRKINISADQKCPVCGVKFLLENGTTVAKSFVQTRELGPVHDACFLPFMGEKNLQLLFEVRPYSIGDTIASTPALRELRRIYPKMKITVMTHYPDLFMQSPHVDAIIDLNRPIDQAILDAFHFRINAFYQDKGHHFATHSVEFSAQCALARTIMPPDWGYELYYSEEDQDIAGRVLQDAGIDFKNDKVILIHPHGTEWSTRDWGPNRFPELAKRIMAKYPDFKVVSIGGKRAEVAAKVMKNYVAIPGAIDLYGKLSLLQSAAMMDFPCMKLLVTPDTGTLHLGATRPELPIVGIFTLIRAYLRTPVRNQRLGYKFIGVEAASGCNCTYDSRFLTYEANFMTCPKRKFLETVDKTNVPKECKVATLQDFDPSIQWASDKIGRLIKGEIAKYKESSLPCFPSVDRVMAAVDQAVKQWT
jgi:ADP-heptose:LPS heptosyltransferase